MDRLFFKTYQFISKNKALSALASLLLLGVLAFFASKIQFEEDISKLIPLNSKTKEVQKILKTVNFTDKIIVNIQRQPDGTVEDLTHYASQFLDSIAKNSKGFVKSIHGRLDDDAIEATLDFLYENAPLFLNEDDYRDIGNKLIKDSLAAITEKNYKTLISPSGIIARKTLLRDPLGISFMALKKMQQLGTGDQFTLKDGFLLSKDEKNVLLFISPTFPSSETSENAVFADQLYSLQDQLNTSFANKASSEYFGAALIAVANAQQIKKDIQFTVCIALTVLILIFIIFYRKLTIPLILFTPTIFGGLLSVAFLYFVRTEISAISLGIGSVLLGVTLDYSLHILTHIRNNESLKSLYHDITMPILMSSLTTAMAFLCLLFLDSQALQDLGIFAAVSVMGASVFALVFIPQLYKGGSKKSLKLTLLDRISAYDFHKNKAFIGLIAILVVISMFTYKHAIFNKDISKLNFEPPAATLAKANLDALTNLESKSVYLASFGNTTEAALLENDTIFRELQKLKNRNEIISFSSIGALIHSEKIQKEQILHWKQYWNPETIQNTKNSLIASGIPFGFKPTSFDQFYNLLASSFEPLSVSDYNAFTTFSIDDFITETDGLTTVTNLIKVDDENAAVVKKVFANHKNTLVIDRQEMNETLLGNLKNDFNTLIVYSLLAVLILLFLFFRSFSLTLVTAIPIGLTWVITIGLMGLFGIEFNIFNIIISTFIFGLGIDYSIFITNGMLKEYQTGEKTLATHKTSIILSVITTILGVGVLIFAKHPALYSISVVSIIGIFSAMIVSFTIQPLLFVLFIGSKTKRPIGLRLLVHSVLSFTYYGLGGLCLSIFSVVIMPIIPLKKKVKMKGFHFVISKFMKSVLYTNPFVKKRIINEGKEDFGKPGIIIANHTSFLDILAVGMLHPKIIFLVNDWVYNSPIFGKAVQLAGFYPVSGGIENGVDHLSLKVAQGYSLMAFPEGTRSTTNKIRRFHKGAFFLAEKLSLDIIPVLIHGNSEVLPKGSFVIRNGSITVKILDRISSEDTSFGTTYKGRTKEIGVFFRKQFESLRSEIEGETYFHDVVKNDYRYKGDKLFQKIKKDLKHRKTEYKNILEVIDKNATIANLSADDGQLDFLLLLDSADRKICTYIEDETTRNIVKNSFITTHYNRIQFASSKKETLSYAADTFIVQASEENTSENKNSEKNFFLGFQLVYKDHKLIIFKQKLNS
jgi:1-acyl-sn-glycerol-3-phosphate acyltransferase